MIVYSNLAFIFMEFNLFCSALEVHIDKLNWMKWELMLKKLGKKAVDHRADGVICQTLKIKHKAHLVQEAKRT